MIDTNNILQVDGVVIAGILILLTISRSILGNNKPRRAVGDVGIPFAISAIIALVDAFKPTPTTFTTSTGFDIALIIAGGFTMIGFGYLIWFFIDINRTKNDESLKK